MGSSRPCSWRCKAQMRSRPNALSIRGCRPRSRRSSATACLDHHTGAFAHAAAAASRGQLSISSFPPPRRCRPSLHERRNFAQAPRCSRYTVYRNRANCDPANGRIAGVPLIPDVKLRMDNGQTYAYGGHIEQMTPMCDVIELSGEVNSPCSANGGSGERRRQAQLFRLSECAVERDPGVQDGAFFLRDRDQGRATGITRLAAAAVAPGLSAASLLDGLRERIDPCSCRARCCWSTGCRGTQPQASASCARGPGRSASAVAGRRARRSKRTPHGNS